MKISYYPGCTLKTKAMNLNLAAIKAMEVLGVELDELPRFNCCGAVYSLTNDDLLHQIAPVRVLARALEQGADKLLTLCPMCYNTLARANLLMKNDEEKRHTINSFMEEEPDYHGEVEVLHLLGFLRDEIGWNAVKAKVQKPLSGMKLAPYYGCTLLRPAEVAIDAPNSPVLFGELVEALGAESIDIPTSTDCCGSYQVISNPGAAANACGKIIDSAVERGAHGLVVTCPLCDYNLAVYQRQQEAAKLPLVYMSQLMAIAFGLDAEVCRFELNLTPTRELFEAKNLIANS
ncbi:MAG: CoB--CoM heterodisulfide reductase iron-sulfur subunit B family protein [Proteobacteria bacterium]|nr:CoB--CoM heterodisulfide reductase iron-sulfur subunit B family protein [Pseudomonadota bacterium]